MNLWNRGTLLASLAVLVLIGAGSGARLDARSAIAQASDDAAMKAYVLDAAKVNGYLSAGEALVAARRTDRSVAADMREMENATTDTLAQARAALKARPRLFGFFQKAGLSIEDAVLIPRVLVAAGVAAQLPGAGDFASPAQVAFAKQNPGTLERFQKLNEAFEGGDDSEDDNGR